MEKNKISVVINTYNASLHLEEVLETVKDFDEIVICDMESTDDTREIAKRYGCKIVIFPKGDYQICEPARQTAIESASYDWVFVVDADELVPAQLKEYLYNFISQKDVPQGLYIPRKSRFLGRFMHCFYPDYQLRFFIKKGTVWPPIIHANPIIQGRIDKVPSKNMELAFDHLPDDGIRGRMNKINQYTENEIEKKKNRNYGIAALFYRPLVRFFRAYIQKGGFRDGKEGFICALYEGVYQFVAVSKILENRWSNHKKIL
nr:glycosyltransferase family 2 protein [uncultured Prevotella sp.]